MNPALFLFSAPAGPEGPVHAFQRLNTQTGANSGSFLAPQKFQILGQTIPSPRCLNRLTECSIWNPLGATGGTQTHSRRTGRKLEQLHRARQALVRVPESNTKYGGNRRKQGVTRYPRLSQVSVSPQRFPSEKNCFGPPDFGFAPLFTGQLFIVSEGLP